jgi:hypothetical protein
MQPAQHRTRRGKALPIRPPARPQCQQPQIIKKIIKILYAPGALLFSLLAFAHTQKIATPGKQKQEAVRLLLVLLLFTSKRIGI